MADVTVNGHPETKGTGHGPRPMLRRRGFRMSMPVVDGTRQRLDELGPKKFADWMRGRKPRPDD
jgi:pyruvate carboxylase